MGSIPTVSTAKAAYLGGFLVQRAIVVGPGGRDVYVTSVQSGSITHFRRSAGGSLRYRGCIADGGANRCRRARIDSLVGATGVAISSSGHRVFVASQVGVVAAFDRAPGNGGLVFSGCVGQDGKGGCADPRRRSLGRATGIATSGADVYVTSQGGDSITRLVDRRGGLEFASCVAARRANGCASGPAAALDGAYALALRGRDLYAAAPPSAALSTFRLARR